VKRVRVGGVITAVAAAALLLSSFVPAGAAASADTDSGERDVATSQYANAPEIFVVDAGEGTPVTLRNETGLTFDLRVQADGRVEPPLLWDGSWELELPGRSQRFSVGEPLVSDTPDRSAAIRIVLTALIVAIVFSLRRSRWRHVILASVIGAGIAGVIGLVAAQRLVPDYGKQLNECWLVQPDEDDDERVEAYFAVTQSGVRCSQSLMFTLAATKGYATAEKAITRARELLGDEAAVWGSFCHIAGDAAASGAVSGGDDPRALMRNHQSFCDYSVSHGVGAMVATMNADDPGSSLEAVCAGDPDADIPTISYTSQCWHGGGMGLARLYRLDRARGLQVCLSAQSGPARMNCIEGLFAFGRDYGRRVADGSWRDLAVTTEMCAQSDATDPAFLDTCFRSAAISYETFVTTYYEDVQGQLYEGVTHIRYFCQGLPAGAKRVGCWSGMANFIALILQRHTDDAALVRRFVAICDSAPDEDGARRACYLRITLGLVRNDQLRNGLEVDELVELTPLDLRAEISQLLNDWLASITGRSS